MRPLHIMVEDAWLYAFKRACRDAGVTMREAVIAAVDAHPPVSRVAQLEKENQALRAELERLR